VDPVQAALYAVVLPAIAAAAVLVAVRAMNKGRAEATGAGPAIAAGFVVGFLGIAGMPSFPPRERWHWMALLAMAAAVVGAIEVRVPEWPRRLLRALCFVAAMVVISVPSDRTSLPTIAVAVSGIVALRGVEGLDRLGGSLAALLPVCIGAIGAAAALAFFSGWAVLGMVCGALASATAACLVVGRRFPVHVRDAMLPATVILATACLNGRHFASLPLASAVLLASTPIGGLLAARMLARRGTPARDVVRAACGAAIQAGLAVALAAVDSPAF
jgi:hypothetical protein